MWHVTKETLTTEITKATKVRYFLIKTLLSFAFFVVSINPALQEQASRDDEFVFIVKKILIAGAALVDSRLLPVS
jgi:hypothetical protein